MSIKSLCGIAALVLAAAFAPAQASKVKTVYTVCSLKDCRDGYPLTGGVARDPGGNLYVVTRFGHGDVKGTVLRLAPGKKKYAAKVLHTFTGFSDEAPSGGLIVDVHGNLYGVTSHTVYKLSRVAGKWQFKVIHQFCPDFDCDLLKGDEARGRLAYAGQSSGALYDGTSPLYGVTESGGGPTQPGIVYSLTPDGTAWDLDVLHAFCQQTDCTDGANPVTGLTVSATGTLYGVTVDGGIKQDFCGGTGCGLAFQLAPGTQGSWNYTVLHAFCQKTDCVDGEDPATPFVIDGEGNLLGTVFARNGGFLFKLVPKGTKSKLSTIVTICCSSLSEPAIAPDGDMYLEGGAGGLHPRGSLYRVSGRTATDLYDFCSKESCRDGQYPSFGLVPDGTGSYFGMTPTGAMGDDQATVFRFTP